MFENKYKICNSCGQENNANESFCTECFSINFLIDENKETKNKNITINYDNQTILEIKTKVLKLKSLDFYFEIKNNDVIGREGILEEQLKNNLKISRRHAKFILNDNSWFIEDLNSTNGTYINDIRLMNDEKKKLKNEDILKLSSSFSLDIIIE